MATAAALESIAHPVRIFNHEASEEKGEIARMVRRLRRAFYRWVCRHRC